MVNSVPSPGELSTEILPPKDSIILRETDKPNPVPLPGSLVVKKGSKISLIFSPGMPIPVSFRVIFTPD